MRITILLSLFLLPSFALAQTQCQNFNFNPPVNDVRLINSLEHATGSHTAATGANLLTPSTNVTGSCQYSPPPAGSNTCVTTCGVVFNPDVVPTTGDTGTLTVPGPHIVSFTALAGTGGGGGAVSCSAIFGMTVTNPSDKTPTVTSPQQPIPISCPAETLPTPTPTPTPAPTPIPTPIPTPTPIASKPGQPCDNDPSGGGTGGDKPDFTSGCSPIIIDSEGEGFHLTSAGTGVMFDISGSGTAIRIAWTDSDYHNAFLALPGADGLVHNGKQLFGNFTSQPASVHPNGFLALAEYDKPENGGNGDGVIDEKDMVFSRLRLWIDANHDGICQPNELHQLSEMNIYSLSFGYFTSSRTDDFGNQFRYKARVNPDERRDKRDKTPSGDPARWAYDVFFVTK